MPADRAFDEDYYRRYYEDPRTRAVGEAEARALGDFVCAYLAYLDLPVTRVLDLGCGLGRWREVVHRHFPRASYTGVEVSEYLCRRFGWQQGSVVDFRARGRFDLVICSDVVQYLDRTAAAAALENLVALTRGALYFAALTTEDWAENCDRERTDGDCHLRRARWYRRRLRPHFREAGGGVWIRRGAEVVLYALETPA